MGEQTQAFGTFGPATRDRGVALMREFTDRMGEHYARNRGFDLGPEERTNVSQLSPFLRRRLVLESEVVAAAMARHGPDAAGKFVQEVVWRTYWKGWLEQRPSVWANYLSELERERAKLDRFRDLRARHDKATEGRTGIDGLDHWAHELVEHGYLHNHARMWFASIWIHTLRLPWVLGADFFHQHLLDGDPASNTLSWRWVAGQQTVGKSYLATASNIDTFTKGRFKLKGASLATDAAPFDVPQTLDPTPLAKRRPVANVRSLLLLTEDDCTPELLDWPEIAVVAIVPTRHAQKGVGASDAVVAFERAALADCARRLGDVAPVRNVKPHELASVAREHEVLQVVGPHIPVGTAADALREPLAKLGVPCRTALREWDARFWPHATKGYFKLKKQIPTIVERLASTRTA